jgi:uncharacterized protein
MSTTNILPLGRSLQNAAHGLRAFLSFLAAFLLCTQTSRAAAGGVLDNGGFFSEQAKSDAAKIIAETERTMHKDILIETFGGIPADLKAGVNLQDKAALTHLFQQWALKQARDKHVNGVYILLAKEPAHLQIEVGNDTQRIAFTLQDRETLNSLMRAKLHAHQNDDALRDGVNFILGTMRAHLPNHARTGTAPVPMVTHSAPSSGGGIGIGTIIIGALVLWVVFGLVRGLIGGMGGGGMAGQPGMGGGGGFFSSLIGGMFGAAAGMWMYDQFFSNHGNSAYGSDLNNPNGGDSGYTGQDTDYSGSGGDFGGDSSGDSGGGGDSGGDFGGGGDSGGGGDF